MKTDIIKCSKCGRLMYKSEMERIPEYVHGKATGWDKHVCPKCGNQSHYASPKLRCRNCRYHFAEEHVCTRTSKSSDKGSLYPVRPNMHEACDFIELKQKPV